MKKIVLILPTLILSIIATHAMEQDNQKLTNFFESIEFPQKFHDSTALLAMIRSFEDDNLCDQAIHLALKTDQQLMGELKNFLTKNNDLPKESKDLLSESINILEESITVHQLLLTPVKVPIHQLLQKR